MGEAVVVVITEFGVGGGATGAIGGFFEMGLPFPFEMGGERRRKMGDLVVIGHWKRGREKGDVEVGEKMGIM